MSGLLVAQIPPGNYVVPTEPPAEVAHATYFETFDGLEPLVNNDQAQWVSGAFQRPAAGGTPVAEQVYTRGPLTGVVGRLGGQPLPVASWEYRTGRGYTEGANWLGNFQRVHYGVGQNYQGAAQTTQLSEITNNPPVPGDLSGIIAGLA